MMIEIHSHPCRDEKVLERIIAFAKEAGIDKAVAMSMSSVFRVDCETGNRELAQACSRHPDRFVPFAEINARATKQEKERIPGENMEYLFSTA